MKTTRSAFILAYVIIILSAAHISRGQNSAPTPARVQGDLILQNIIGESRERSQLYSLAQELLDSIGPRLTGTVEQKRANDWALAMYKKWGITARAEQYGTWIAWRRGVAHFDLISPRVRTLGGVLSTWSPGTKGTVEGPVVLFPKIQTLAEFEAALPQVKGKFVLFSYPWPSCRPDASWKEFANDGSFDRMQKERSAGFDAWYAGRVRKAGLRGREIFSRFSQAGALGVVTLLVPPPAPQGWGVGKISSTISDSLPEIGMGCEDYGLLFRLAENGQGPVLRVNAEAEFTGEVPVSNVIAELRGTEKPNEYVVLSAHFDSWDAASGATDNGTGAIVMMEAMRILKNVYPNPKRTILAASWNGEEQGLNGSGAFAADHPEVIKGMQILLNSDSGTGRIEKISMQGFSDAAPSFRRWLSRMPEELGRKVTLVDPGALLEDRIRCHFFATERRPLV